MVTRAKALELAVSLLGELAAAGNQDAEDAGSVLDRMLRGEIRKSVFAKERRAWRKGQRGLTRHIAESIHG